MLAIETERPVKYGFAFHRKSNKNLFSSFILTAGILAYRNLACLAGIRLFWNCDTPSAFGRIALCEFVREFILKVHDKIKDVDVKKFNYTVTDRPT